MGVGGWEFRAQRGLSLIEATIILAVISTLTAVLAPSVRSYVITAQQAAARKDVGEIASALARMLDDVGEQWLARDGNGSLTTEPPSHASANRVDLLVSDGDIPTVYDPRSLGSPDWDAAVNNTTVGRLEYYLVTNMPSNDAANAYRDAEEMGDTLQFDPDDGSLYNSPRAWRGAYLPGPIGADPWGNRYSANVEFLAKDLGAGPNGNVNDVIVISAGSNGLLEVRYDTDGATSANDIFAVVSGGTR